MSWSQCLGTRRIQTSALFPSSRNSRYTLSKYHTAHNFDSSCTSDPRLARSSLQVDRGAISRRGRPTHEPYSAATLLIVSDSRKFKLEEHASAMKGITKCRLRRFEVGLNAHR